MNGVPTMIFTGTYEHTIDTKGRLAIPAGVRGQIQRGAGQVEGQSVPLFVVPGDDGAHLCLYTQEVFERRAAELENSNMAPEELLAYEEIFHASTRQVELDTQGRVQVPKDLLEQVGLGNEVVILGVKDHLKVRDREAWALKKQGLFQKNPGILMNPRMAKLKKD